MGSVCRFAISGIRGQRAGLEQCYEYDNRDTSIGSTIVQLVLRSAAGFGFSDSLSFSRWTGLAAAAERTVQMSDEQVFPKGDVFEGSVKGRVFDELIRKRISFTHSPADTRSHKRTVRSLRPNQTLPIAPVC